MSKWIAEFDLEDGDTMPEYMDLEYKGVKLDFHCRPLEQEPFINKPCVSSGVCEHDKNEVLDKIRAEVENINVWGMRYNPDTDKDRKPQIVQKVKEHVIEIIDKYKAEQEAE